MNTIPAIFKWSLACFCSALLFVACAGDPQTEADSEPPFISLVCATQLDSLTQTPHSDVFLHLEQVKVKVADIQACDPIPASDFTRYNIPADALAACGGWWAGAGDYVYVLASENGYDVFQGWQDEMQEDEGFHYELVYQWVHPGAR